MSYTVRVDLKVIRNAIKLRRHEMGLKQSQLGDILDISGAAFGRLENGKSQFSIEQLKKVCDYLGLDFKDLESQLPTQSKPALVSADEYVKLTNQLIKLQEQVFRLQEQVRITHFNSDDQKLKFFANTYERMKFGLGDDYQPDWTAIAKAAGFHNANHYEEEFRRYVLHLAEHDLSSLPADSIEARAAALIDEGIAEGSLAPDADRLVYDKLRARAKK